jgi:phosphatidylglycerophosphatase A
MNTKTDATGLADEGSTSQPPKEKSSFALFLATAGGLGYFPKAPGTLGSLVGVVISVAVAWFWCRGTIAGMYIGRNINFWTEQYWIPGLGWIAATLFVAVIGVWASHRVAKTSETKDPQFVIIDEVSGQQLTYLLAGVGGNWKYLLLGFILFRLFDIWKPSPAREAESLPGGWGIMADDWVAGIYAAIGLWLARAAGL